MIKWIKRLFEKAMESEIVVGDYWMAKRDEGNPFAEWKFKITGYQNGWIQYQFVRNDDGYEGSKYSKKEKDFRLLFEPREVVCGE